MKARMIPSEQGILELKAILQGIHRRAFSYDEAFEIGKWWLGYVQKLADGKRSCSAKPPGGSKIKKHTTNPKDLSLP